MDETSFKVIVVKACDRRNLVLRYVDPVTGKHVTKSAETSNRRKAERAAARWEAELREGRFRPAVKISWDEFRERYEQEYLPGLADGTFGKIQALFNLIERVLRPRRLSDVTSSAISKLQAEMRKSQQEATIKSNLAHLKAALRWAVRMDLLVAAPVIEKPPRSRNNIVMKGRPITAAEFDRMLRGTPEIVGEAAAADWRRLLQGLWLSGLRLSEALNLSWTDDDLLRVDLTHEFPLLHIPAALEKGNQDRLLPITPDFGAFLLETPPERRTGHVFHARGRRISRPVDVNWAGRMISAIGKAADVRVSGGGQGKREKFASAHDLRRSFGERWALRVMPHVLKELMRHASIETTMRYYVGRNALTVARSIYEANSAGAEARQGYILGYSPPLEGPPEST